MDQYKAIIFDWDGTLVDSTDWVLGAHNHVRQFMEQPLWTKDDIFGCSSLSTRELYPEIYGDRAQEAMDLLSEYTTKYNLQGANPYEKAEALLLVLRGNGHYLGVVSNKRHEPLNEMVDHLNWREYFTSIVGAGYADRDKPSATPLLLSINEINRSMEPRDILYVGDTETDLLCAKNAGCDIAFIQTGGERPDLIRKYAPTYSFMTTKEFYSFCQEQKNEKTSKIA
ncbi:MAG: HAD family hydrolase [Alphaproteobacteria bacterium]|nr:HAD family hydrolase [Alphaproteobacteria bacterium]